MTTIAGKPKPAKVATSVVILSPERWVGLPTNKHQLALQFHRTVPTLYVSASGRSIIKALRRRRVERRSPTLERHCDGLWCLEPIVLPETLARRSSVVLAVNQWLVHRSVLRATRKLGLNRSLLLVYSPMFLSSVGKLSEIASVYHCVDHYASFPAWERAAKAKLVSLEQRLLLMVDLVITTSPALTRHCGVLRPDVVEFPNVADFDLFVKAAEPGPVPDEVVGLPKPIIFFHGAISPYKVDLSLLKHLAISQEQWSFVIVGPEGELGDAAPLFSRIMSLPNVHWLGPRSQRELPAYLRAADVLLLPYIINEHTRHVFPLKFFEYMATGKPIVSTPLEALSAYQAHIFVAEGPENWEKMIAVALRNGLTGSEARRELARGQTWEMRVRSIRDLLLERKGVSIG
jgi:glycosyltransferase involved in cell wall biosynthesis